MQEFRDTVALVTGAAGAIGSAVVGRLLAAGSRVALVDQQSERLVACGAGVGNPLSTRVYPLDLSQQASFEALVSRIEQELGTIRYLVHAAGTLLPASALQASLEDWDASFSTNARAPLLLSQSVARRLVELGLSGSIVAIGSNAAASPRSGMAVYGASKAALTYVTRALGLELAAYGVRCNVVSPGSTDTPMLRAWTRDMSTLVAGTPSHFKLGIPLGRVAQPSDVADATVYLLSEAARHVTMHDLRVDGGATLDA